MLVGGDLGFLSSVLLAAFVAVFGPVLGFVVRRKWRRSVARREEIKRLLVLASEESARAELLAAQEYGYASGSGYGYDYGYNSSYVKDVDEVFVETPVAVPATASLSSPVSSLNSGSRQLQYQCAVCSLPTSTRCSQCKTVRYCSGKCQILHWRQGHKDECRPVSNSDHRNDVEATYRLKAYKQEPNGCQSIEVEGRHSSESGDAFPAEASRLRSKHAETSGDADGQSLTGAKSANLNSSFVAHSTPREHLDFAASSESSADLSTSENDSDGSDSHQSAGIGTVKIQTSHSKVDVCKAAYSGQPKQVHAGDTILTSGNYNHTKPRIHGDSQSKCSTSTSLSSSSSVDISSESSLSEPSTPSSSGFWGGAVPYSSSRIGPLDSIVHSPSTYDNDIKISDSQSTSYQPPEMARPLDSEVGAQGSNLKKNLGSPNPVTVEVRKSFSRAESRFEVKDAAESGRSPALQPVTLNKLDVHESNEKCTLTSEEVRYSSSSASGNNLNNHDGLKVNSLPSSSPNQSYRGIEGSTSVLQMPKDRQKESSPAKTSGSHISSSNGRESLNVKSAKIDSTRVASACSAESSVSLPNARNGLKTSVLKVVDQFRGSKLTRHNSLGDESEFMGKYGNKGLFPYESFVKLYNWKSELRPFGLVNCGNSCYANAVLQCLAFTPPFTSYFLQGLHSKACEKKGWCFTCEFESLVLKAKDGNSPLSPIRIISHLESIGSNLGNGREEDAHEFLRYVIDTMQSICLKEAGVTASGSFEEETTLVGLTFGGYLRSKIECMRCGGKSERQERMMDLTVEIDGDIGTLEEALRQFTHTETLDGENKYRCGRCKSYEKAKKKLRVLEAPNILTVALKRFQSGKFGKLNKTIKFPEILNLAPYMSGTSDKSPVYQLYGVVVHLDVMNAAFSGHYVCYVRSFQSKWFKVDDSSVKSVELERVLSMGAYMLLYSRCSPRSPRIMRSLTIPRDPRRSKQLTCKSRSHTRNPWDSSHGDSMGQTCSDCSYPSHTSVRPSRSIFEDDCTSEQSSSLFSEVGSCSTESTNRDSTSTDDFFDHIFCEPGGWNSPWRSSSDSDTSSSSSSSPSPLYSRHSPLADLDRYASAVQETSSSSSGGAERAGDGHGFWTGLPDRNGHASVPESNGRTPLCHNSSKHCRNLVSSHSISKADSSRLGRVNPSDNSKSPVTCRDR